MINGAFELLDLITFFTVGEEIGQSWHMKRGGTVYDAAGEIHTDIQQGFVRAEVINFQELIDAGGYSRRPRQGHAAARRPRLRDAGRRRDHRQAHELTQVDTFSFWIGLSFLQSSVPVEQSMRCACQ